MQCIKTFDFYRTYENYTVIRFEREQISLWGRCRPECKGEMPSPVSKYNLARNSEVFNSAWSHGLYDLFDWGKGFCYTYDPPQKSRGGAPNGLYFLLGHKYFYEKDYNNYDNKSIKWSSTNSSGTLVSFDIFLHEKVTL